MKKLMIVFLALLLCGCQRTDGGIDRAMALRTSLLGGNSCGFEARISADFGDTTYTFSLSCEADPQGNVVFTVIEPEYIEGITGTVEEGSGKLTFDGTALVFDLQTEGILSPVSGPWIMLKGLRSGYVRSCTREGDLFRITVNDSYEENALMLDIWLDDSNRPVWVDIYEDNRRILTMEVANFAIQ